MSSDCMVESCQCKFWYQLSDAVDICCVKNCGHGRERGDQHNFICVFSSAEGNLSMRYPYHNLRLKELLARLASGARVTIINFFIVPTIRACCTSLTSLPQKCEDGGLVASWRPAARIYSFI